MKTSQVILALLFFARLAMAQVPDEQKLQSLIGAWDVYMREGDQPVGEFTVQAFGKSPGIQTKFSLPSMQSETNGVWVFDKEINSITVFEITNTGDVHTYAASFRKPDVLSFTGYAKKNGREITEESSLTWLSPDKIEIWSKDVTADIEVKMMMVKRK